MKTRLLFVFLLIRTINSLELSKYFDQHKKHFFYSYFLLIEKLSSCQAALGMQSGSIPDSSISVSSSYDFNSVGPKASR